MRKRNKTNMGKIIAILNQKGGVGKTTTAINLSSSLAKSGRTVLLVDLDPQGNATSGLGIAKPEAGSSMYEVLLGERSLQEIVKETTVAGLYIAPTSAELAATEIELVERSDREYALA